MTKTLPIDAKSGARLHGQTAIADRPNVFDENGGHNLGTKPKKPAK